MAETATKPKKQYYLGTGRRKTAVARVRLAEGAGSISINGRPLDNYFTEDKDRNAVLGPLLLTEMKNRLDVTVKVRGGGFTGQAGAISQGMARALKIMFAPPAGPTAAAAGETAAGQPAAAETPAAGMDKKLRDSGYLTRDGRMKERKKYGRKGARKSFQFSKR
ncbi:MAG: 30S ribosomal protein S9 [Gemmataceae bacterium]|nr:30S ribosomal protein S9 [Gemmataceae bacterium]